MRVATGDRRQRLEVRLDPRAGSLFAARETEAEVEVILCRRDPGTRTAHAALVCLQFLGRGLRDTDHGHVARLQMWDDAVECVRDRRAGRAAGFIVGAEHEVVDDKLTATVEQLCQRPRAVVGVEGVFLLDRDPWQLPPLTRQFVAQARVLLLVHEELLPRRTPFVARTNPVLRHRLPSSHLLGPTEPAAQAEPAVLLSTTSRCYGRVRGHVSRHLLKTGPARPTPHRLPFDPWSARSRPYSSPMSSTRQRWSRAPIPRWSASA